MEHETCFNLDTALIEWRSSLEAFPEISIDDLRELESHLLDTFQHEIEKGSQPQDAFATAVRQVGAAHDLAREYAKLNPFRSWAVRAAMIASAGALTWLWSTAFDVLFVLTSIAPRGAQIAIFLFANSVLPLVLIAMIVNGRARVVSRAASLVFSSRALVALVSVMVAALISYGSAWAALNMAQEAGAFVGVEGHRWSVARLCLEHLRHLASWPGPVLALLVWLAPHARQALVAAGLSGKSGLRMSRQLVLWVAFGCISFSCFSMLTGVAYSAFNGVAVWLSADSELRFRVITQIFVWTCNLALPVTLLQLSRGKIHLSLPRSRTAFLSVGTAVVLICLTLFGASLKTSPSTLPVWLAATAFWPVVALALITWLLPEAHGHRQSA